MKKDQILVGSIWSGIKIDRLGKLKMIHDRPTGERAGLEGQPPLFSYTHTNRKRIFIEKLKNVCIKIGDGENGGGSSGILE